MIPNRRDQPRAAEDFDQGCPGDTYYDSDETNAGGKYRPGEGVDIEVCSVGGFNTGWAKSGEWMTYSVNVKKTGTYKLTVYIATATDESKMHIEFDGVDKTGIIQMPNTGGYQSWETVETTVNLIAGRQVMKVCIDNASLALNLDKMSFELE